MRDQKKIGKHIYHPLYILAKGDQFDNKWVLIQSIHELKALRAREVSPKDQVEVRKGRARTNLKRKAAREENNIFDNKASGQRRHYWELGCYPNLLRKKCNTLSGWKFLISGEGGGGSQGGYNGFGDVFPGEILPGATRWDIFRHKANRSELRDPCMDKHKPKPIKALYLFLRRIFL